MRSIKHILQCGYKMLKGFFMETVITVGTAIASLGLILLGLKDD